MSNQSKRSVSRSIVMGALLLLAATASGCGVGLPTQPEVDQTAVNQRSAGTAGGWMELGDIADGDGDPTPVFTPDPEIQVPTPDHRPGNSTWGHSRKKHNK